MCYHYCSKHLVLPGKVWTSFALFFSSDEELETAIFSTGRKLDELLQVRFGNYLLTYVESFKECFYWWCMWCGFTPTVWGTVTANTRSRVLTCFIRSLWNSMPSLHKSYHALSPPLGVLHTHTDCPQDNTARPIPRPCPGLPLFDSFICLFGYQQTPRTQTFCLLYQMAGSRKLQPSGFLVYSPVLLGKLAALCPYDTEKTLHC